MKRYRIVLKTQIICMNVLFFAEETLRGESIKTFYYREESVRIVLVNATATVCYANILFVNQYN